MNITIVSNGNNVYDYRFLRKMLERGHAPSLVSYWPAPVNFQLDGVPFTHHDPRFPRMPRIALHLRRLLKQSTPDILHAGWVQTNGLACALSNYHPMLLMPWGSDILLDADRSPWNRWITRFTIRHSDMITCDSEVVKEKIVQISGYPKEKIIVFPWGVNLSVFQPGPDSTRIRERLGWDDKQILIMNRRFAPIYGVNYFIESLPAVIRKEPNTRVILIGSGHLEAQYKAQVEQLGINEYVYFAGWVETELEMSNYLRAANVYVSTPLSDGTSASLLEAMACGLPVVVSDAPGSLEWVQDGTNGFVVPQKSTGMLANRLTELLKDPTRREEMGTYNVSLANERANWETNFDVLESVYDELIGRHK